MSEEFQRKGLLEKNVVNKKKYPELTHDKYYKE